MAQEQAHVKERQHVDLSKPRKYKVVMYNDDTTTMDFVIHVLQTVFFKTSEEAFRLMMTVHTKEKAVVGVYSLDIAQSKTKKATLMARAEGFPLRLECLPE